ncbi:MAG: sugar ABC transporter substrate-binding protein [Chloroflexota bacterium]|nr:MAG: sugar ABC transporter substrate-binding protein [Chloroflexota bacterium]
MKKTLLFVIALLVIASMLLTACKPATTEEVAPSEEEAEVVEEVEEAEEVVEEAEEVEETEKVQIRWFVGLGTGAQPEQVPLEEAVVARFNETHDNIELVVEFVDNAQAPDQLKTQIAAGDPPDIIGPVGWSGTNEFTGLFLDLEPYMGDFDWSDFDMDSVAAYRLNGEDLLGLPFAVFPSMIFYNTALFDEAGLEYPPHEWGGNYADGEVWDIAKLEELAMYLTVDANGNDATMDEFDPENIVQFGYHTQWTDPRGQAAALFGGDNFIDADGNAVLSDTWREAFNWYYEGMHEKHFMPNATYQGSDLLAAGNPFDSGNVAMVHCHLWYTCCLGTVGENWDIAAVPSHGDGQLVSKLHADTFRVFAATEHPEEAVEVLLWLTGEGAGDLLQIYGGMPGRKSLQEEFFAGLDEQFPQGVDWQVAIDGLAYPETPNHESNLPNYAKAYDRIGAFQTLYETEAGLDINAELDKLIADLQAIFDEVK